MKQLYSARNALEAHDLRFFLAAHDIDAKVTGDNNAFETFISFTPQSAPCVFVDDADFERASALLVQFANRQSSPESQPAWTCRNCQEAVESQFDLCWKCGTPREGAASEEAPLALSDNDRGEETPHIDAKPLDVVTSTVPSLTRSTWIVWLEVLAVLVLTMPLYGGHSLPGYVLISLGVHNNAADFYLASLLQNAFVVVITLTAIRLSRDPWSEFGIKKPTALDLFTGGIVCVVDSLFTTMGVSIFLDILKSMYSERYVYQLIHTPRPSYHAQGWIGLVTLLVLAIAIGFSEELLLRGYLIPRLERLLRSTWASVLVSAAVFGLLHWRSGVLTVCHAFLGGIVYGIAFAWTRRLWPVAIAHAMYDFSAMLYGAG
jgi:membrane protease YdiL (CAAX protease family)